MRISISDPVRHRPKRLFVLGTFNLKGLHPRIWRDDIAAQKARIEREKHG